MSCVHNANSHTLPFQASGTSARAPLPKRDPPGLKPELGRRARGFLPNAEQSSTWQPYLITYHVIPYTSWRFSSLLPASLEPSRYPCTCTCIARPLLCRIPLLAIFSLEKSPSPAPTLATRSHAMQHRRLSEDETISRRRL